MSGTVKLLTVSSHFLDIITGKTDKDLMMKNIKTLSISMVAILALAGCAPQGGYYANNGIVGQQTINNAVVGAATAATTRMLTGGNSRDILRDAAVGAAVGVVGGAVSGQLQQPAPSQNYAR